MTGRVSAAMTQLHSVAKIAFASSGSRSCTRFSNVRRARASQLRSLNRWTTIYRLGITRRWDASTVTCAPCARAALPSEGNRVSALKYQLTYSQNREDLILAGILRNVAVGFYVDVGANHPEFHSVSKLFYDKGWSGISIEPNETLHAELGAQRPRDVNIRAGIASQSGSLTFRSFPLDGISTFSNDRKGVYEAQGYSGYRDSSVEVVTLSEVLRSHRPS